VTENSLDEMFEDEKKSFGGVVDFALRISLKLNGEPANEQSELYSIVQTKMSVTGASIEHLFSAPLKDHSAVIALCRMIMEAMTLFFYLKETVSEDEWAARYLCLKLHDTTNRIKLMRGHQSADQYADLELGKNELTTELRKNVFFCSLEKEQQSRVETGEHFFLGGMNRAARAAGWDFKKFISFYSYFSAHAHSSPMSFLRTKKHGIRYADPSDAQKAAMVTAIGIAEYCLLNASIAYLNTSVEGKKTFESKELEKFDKSLSDWKGQLGLQA